VNALLAVLSFTMLAQVVWSTVPYACAAIGGAWSQRSGVLHVGLDGLLLGAALAAFVGVRATGSPWAGAVAGVVAASALAAAHAALILRRGADPIVIGVALNLVAGGAVHVAARWLGGATTAAPPAGFHAAWLAGGAAACAAATAAIVHHTRFGLRLRAAGDDPAAAATVGIAVTSVRAAALVIAGAICGIGGVALAYGHGRLDPGMSGGRGLIALAVVILSAGRPWRAAAACLFFGVLDALHVVLAARGGSSGAAAAAAAMLPPLIALIAFVLIARRAGAERRAVELGQAAR